MMKISASVLQARGAIWVVAQGLLCLGFVLMPSFSGSAVESLPPSLKILRGGVMIFFGAVAGLFFLWGGWAS